MNLVVSYLFQQTQTVSLFLPEATGMERVDLSLVMTAVHRWSELGYLPSPVFLSALKQTDIDSFADAHEHVMTLLTDAAGVRVNQDPFYQNFPADMMELSDARLFFNAVLHYLSQGQWQPQELKKLRAPLNESNPFKVIHLGDESSPLQLLELKLKSQTSLSQQDQGFVREMFKLHPVDVLKPWIPAEISQREIAALVGSELLNAGCLDLVKSLVKTPHDVLRLAVALNGGDISLSQVTYFNSFKRPHRRFLLALLNECRRLEEEMWQQRNAWLRLGERLHPGEFKLKYPRAAVGFDSIRNQKRPISFMGKVEAALAKKEVSEALQLLSKRSPSDLARRLDHLLRLEVEQGVTEALNSTVIAQFNQVVAEVPTPLLWSLRAHFATRHLKAEARTFIPKGTMSKLYGTDVTPEGLPESMTTAIVVSCEKGLQAHYGQLTSLGTVYLDESLKKWAIPSALRSTQASKQVVGRGSRFEVPATTETLRLFVYWKDGAETHYNTVDLDLNALCYNTQGELVDTISFYHLTDRKLGIAHSGDFVSGEKGAAEYIDLPVEALKASNIAYVMLHVQSYSGDTFDALDEAFVGWMVREKPESGEVFEPTTVAEKLTLSAQTTYTIPMVWDVQAQQVIWMDMSLPFFEPCGTADGTANLSHYVLQHALTQQKPSLYELFEQHVIARGGTLVETESEAEHCFGGETGLQPGQAAEILANYF